MVIQSKDVLNKEGKQYHIHCKKGDIGRYVLLPGDPFRTDIIAEYLDDAKLIAHNREHKTWTGTLLGEKVSVTSTGMGCPAAAIAVEELIHCGADTFIRIGTAGKVSEQSMQEDVDGVIITGAVRDEGTTIHYIPIEYPAMADRHVVSALAHAVSRTDLHYLEGIAQCKDSFYGQHDPDSMPNHYRLNQRWDAWKRGHVHCSEMETAALFIVSQIRNCRAGAIMSFTNMQETIRLACEAIKELIIQDKGKTSL